MSKLAGLVCALVLGSILAGCADVQPQRQMDTRTYHHDYKDER